MMSIGDNNKSVNGNRYIESFSFMKTVKLYNHIGKQVFRDHMNLSNVDISFLLLVEPFNKNHENQIETIMKIYGNENRIKIAYCIPNEINNNNI